MTENVVVTLESWRDRIAAEWRKSVEGIINTGKLLIEAKAALAHGEWGKMFLGDERLPFSRVTAFKLMAVGKHGERFVAHVQHLPHSWGTLYELTKLTDRQWKKAVETGDITPELERDEAVALKETRKPKVADPQPAGDAGDDDEDESGPDFTETIAAIHWLGEVHSIQAEWDALLKALADPEHESRKDWLTREMLARAETVEALRELANVLEPTEAEAARAAEHRRQSQADQEARAAERAAA
jgi:hypothetical protein